ncbi:MAG: hypothetical protein K2M15_00425 [Oscillospiraceae bacterium]|nr:hypothetical protein [Oscillospiraceae bacterium]MDE7171325.1 hypothetical protein [Oscillospiraceae bacterium]
MRKLTACVLMMTLLLCGCKAGTAAETPEEAALALREEYQALSGWSATVDISVCYSEAVYDFTLDTGWQRDGETVLTVTAPELLAGITARIAQGETVLEYDGAGLSLGLLDGAGLTPVSAVTAMMEQIEKGYMAKCAWAGENSEYLQISFQDPELEANTGTQFLLIFDRASRALLRAEVSVAGETVLTAKLSNFTTEMAQYETGNSTDLG